MNDRPACNGPADAAAPAPPSASQAACCPAAAARGGLPVREPPRTLASAELLAGHREVAITHAGETYRLRVTSKDKLILMK